MVRMNLRRQSHGVDQQQQRGMVHEVAQRTSFEDLIARVAMHHQLQQLLLPRRIYRRLCWRWSSRIFLAPHVHLLSKSLRLRLSDRLHGGEQLM